MGFITVAPGLRQERKLWSCMSLAPGYHETASYCIGVWKIELNFYHSTCRGMTYKPRPFRDLGHSANINWSPCQKLNQQIYALGRPQPLSWGSNQFSRCQHVITWLHCTNDCLPHHQLVSCSVIRPYLFANYIGLARRLTWKQTHPLYLTVVS